MNKTSNNITKTQLTTDDLAFSAYLKMKGYDLIKLNQLQSKKTFTFEINKSEEVDLKVKFINSPFLSFYNEIRNLKKLI